MKLNVKSELKQATITITSVQKAVPKAITSALNRVSQGLTTEASRQVRKRYNIKDKDVKHYGNIRVTKADVARLQVTLSSKGRNIPLIKFSTNPSRVRRVKILKASVKRGGKKPIPGAFIASMSSGHTGVFMRSGKRRLPIGERYGPAVPIMLNEPSVTEALNEQAQVRMAKRLDHEMNRVLGRLKVT